METATSTPQAPETHGFRAEIRQLLDIVIHSLYSNRDVFVRELISNAADALEKMRHTQLTNPELEGAAIPLDIRIELDESANTFTIVDNGVGMTREELDSGLGTIAHSGTKAFLQTLQESGGKPDLNLIGKFGVGFYSAFIVADKVTVLTRSWKDRENGWEWTSDGGGSYHVAPREGLERGTKIIINLKDTAKDYAKESYVREVIQRFSNFVPVPVLLGGDKVNTVQALWTRTPRDVSEKEYAEFYEFIGGMGDAPRYTIHFASDVPVAIQALLFVPESNIEKFGFGRMEPSVDLYSRKVLIQKRPEGLLPEWMRFLTGVVDSEDLPLNVSREFLQDNALVRRIAKSIVGRVLKFLAEQLKEDSERYDKFFDEFGLCLKEGATQDFAHRMELAKLLRFESSHTEPGKRTSFPEYVARMKDGQKAIYFLNGPNRAAIEGSPSFEVFRERGIEVLYTKEPIDDFVMSNLLDFDGKALTSGDRGDLELGEVERKGEQLSDVEAESLCGWLKSSLGDRVGTVRLSKRLVTSPAVATTDGPVSAAMQRVLVAMGKEDPAASAKSIQLEINPANNVVRQLQTLRVKDEDYAKLLGEQMLDNALLSAGLLTDPRAMVERLNAILAKAAEKG